MYIEKVPCISSGHVSEEDFQKFVGSRPSNELLCMFDPNDEGSGCFIRVDEIDPGETTQPPEGYSEAFANLWRWAQREGFTWLRLVEWGDAVPELEIHYW